MVRQQYKMATWKWGLFGFFLGAMLVLSWAKPARADGNGNHNSGDQSQSQSQSQHQNQYQGQSQKALGVGVGVGVGGSGGANSNSIQVNDSRDTPPAIAPGLAASNEACMGSSSAGGSAAVFGFSIGTTWKNADCERRMNAKTIAALGDTEAAKALLCTDPKIAAAYASVKRPCSTAALASVKPAALKDENLKQTSFIQ